MNRDCIHRANNSFFGDEASESGVVRSIFVSTATSVAATSLVGVFIVTISAIGDIAVHVLLYLFARLVEYRVELHRGLARLRKVYLEELHPLFVRLFQCISEP